MLHSGAVGRYVYREGAQPEEAAEDATVLAALLTLAAVALAAALLPVPAEHPHGTIKCLALATDEGRW